MKIERSEKVVYTIKFTNPFREDVSLNEADAEELYQLLGEYVGQPSPPSVPVVYDGGGDKWELQLNGKYTLRWGNGDQSTTWCDYTVEDIREGFGLEGDIR